MPTKPPFEFGLHQISDHCFAFMQPDGGWGLNNTLLYIDSDESLLVDTLCDLPRTQTMLSAMADAHRAAKEVDKVLLTHWHCDHVFGVCADPLCKSCVIASQVCADYIASNPPAAWLGYVSELTGDARKQMDLWLAGRFDFKGVKYRAPDQTFEGRTEISVGSSRAVVVETGPSHTRSDSVVHFPDDGVAHTGDLVAIDRHVSMQFPGISTLIGACELMVDWGAEIYVTGHGPLATLKDMRNFVEYLRFVQDRIRSYYVRGLTVDQATDELLRNLGPYRALRNPTMLWFTVQMGYYEYAGEVDQFARRNNAAFAAKVWQLGRELPKRHPELYAQFA